MPEELAGQVAPVPSAQTETKPEADPAPQAAAPTDGTEPPKDEKPTQAPEPKTFTQDELNEIIRREKAKAEAKAERRALRAYRETLERVLPQQQPQAADDGRPTRAQYANEDDFFDALADWKLDQRDQAVRHAAQREAIQRMAGKTESIYAKAERLPGFDREAFDELPLTRSIAAAIVESDMPDRLMAFMASNPDEVERIASLAPSRQAAEIGRLEAKLASVPKTSNAPAPIKPIGTRGTASPGDLSQLSQAEYEAMRKKQGAPWARR